MSLSWTGGERIQKLPKLVQPLAVLTRNLIQLSRPLIARPQAKFKAQTDPKVFEYRNPGEIHYRESRIEVYKKLAFGVEGVCENGVEGDVAEFGTGSGSTARVMACAISEFDRGQNGALRKLHLFDSFQGLPDAEAETDQESPLVKSGVWGKGSCIGASKNQLMKFCAKFLSEERVVIYDGWFKDTLPQIPQGTKFAMINIDCDLYQSAIEVLDYIFSQGFVQEGTYIFFDDWNCNRASSAFGERRAWSEVEEKFAITYTDCGEYGRDGRKFIIHSYDQVGK